MNIHITHHIHSFIRSFVNSFIHSFSHLVDVWYPSCGDAPMCAYVGLPLLGHTTRLGVVVQLACAPIQYTQGHHKHAQHEHTHSHLQRAN